MEFDEFGNAVSRIQAVEEQKLPDTPNVSLAIETHDTSKNKPILQSKKAKVVNGHYYNKPPRYNFDKEYLSQLAKLPERIQNIGIVGPFNSGKTMLSSFMLMKHYRHHHNDIESMNSVNLYLDNSKIEMERHCSTKLNGGVFLGQDMSEKSWYCQLTDFPGHVDFWDEFSVGLKMCDVFCVVVDCCEGVTSIVHKIYRNLKKRNVKKIVFVVNKIDRLILELKLDPTTFYLKVRSIVNDIKSMTQYDGVYYSPEENNVLFASGKLNFIFSLKEFVQKFYFQGLNRNMNNVENFTKRMWGDVSYANGVFSSTLQNGEVPTFIEFIVNPLYKIITHTLTLPTDELSSWLLKNFKINYKEPNNNEFVIQLKAVFQHVFESTCGFIDSVSTGTSYSKHDFANNTEDTIAHIVKTIDYCGAIWSIVKVYKGTITKGRKYMVIDSNTDVDMDDEDELSEIPTAVITDIATMGGRFLDHVEAACENQIVVIKDLHELYTKSATLVSSSAPAKKIFRFDEIPMINESDCKIVLQPYHPKELSQLVKGLNMVNRIYPSCCVKVEDSGEQTVFGTGEMYLDTLLYDLRNTYTDTSVEIKSTANPITTFKEGVSRESFASIPVCSKNFEISIIAKPLDEALVRDLSSGDFDPNSLMSSGRRTQLSRTLRQEYQWDVPNSKNCWTFEKTNCFVNDTLADEVDATVLSNQYKNCIIQGFRWCCKEGPLVEEFIHGVQFSLIKVKKLNDSAHVSLGELAPLVRKACFVAIMTAQPILYEPIYEIDVITRKVYYDIVKTLIKKRRGGKFHKEVFVEATPLIELRGQIPVIDSYGVEIDITVGCNGNAIVQQHTESHIWRKVPGNVMDYGCALPKLEPVPYESLSRDFVMKTRRRKGLDNDSVSLHPEDEGPSLKKYIDLELYDKMKQAGLI